MKKVLVFLFVMIMTSADCLSQKRASGQVSRFSNVNCLLLINYPSGLSSGRYVYKNYRIEKRESEFAIEGMDRNRLLHSWTVPYTREEMPGYDSAVNLEKSPLRLYKGGQKAEHYVSLKETFEVNGITHTIYKHISYNCYDPRCGMKHGHTSFVTGVTYFSPDYGVLVKIDNQNMQFNLMASMKEKKVPHELVVRILESRKTDERIIREYIAKTR